MSYNIIVKLATALINKKIKSVSELIRQGMTRSTSKPTKVNGML